MITTKPLRIHIRSEEALNSFSEYCTAHPSLRFWQALRNWSGHNFVLVTDTKDGGLMQDTFYWEGKSS